MRKYPIEKAEFIRDAERAHGGTLSECERGIYDVYVDRVNEAYAKGLADGKAFTERSKTA